MSSRTAAALKLVEGGPVLAAPRKLDIACGQNKQPGYMGIDIAGDADIVHDLNVFPWPIKAGSVREAFCSHYVEHLPHEQPLSAVLGLLRDADSFESFRARALESLWQTDGWFMFWNEVDRVMRVGGVIQVVTPYVWNSRAFWDPTHTRYHHEMTWSYLDVEWRKLNGLDHYSVTADFEIVGIDAGVSPEFQLRSNEQQQFARQNYKDVIGDMSVRLKKKKR